MKAITFPASVMAIVLAVTLLAGCPSQSVDVDALQERITALESSLETLRQEGKARDQELKEELSLLRTNLDAIRELMQLEQERPGQLGQNGTTDESPGGLDDKAKSFVEKNLNRLMDLTRKLLDKMEKELDKQLEQPAPAPEGREI